MQEITVTPLEALDKLIGVASMIDTNECKDEAMYGALQGALVVAQTALAMAPKQEADHINDVVKMVAPAGWKLVPEDPTGDMFRAAAKIDNEMFAGGSSHGAEDGQVWAAMYDAAPESPVAAPAAANGAPEPTMINGRFYYTAEQMLAAAGPDAALINERESFEAVERASELARDSDGNYENPCVQSAWEGWQNRAALSGAKGN